MPTSLARLLQGEHLEEEQFLELLSCEGDEVEKAAGAVAKEHFGREIKLRGLIEISNYCRSDCYYCGIFPIIVVPTATIVVSVLLIEQLIGID